MKISKLFHWLYAAVMFIPLLVIPVFAIYARNEYAQFGYEVTQEVNKVVDFNQQVKNGNFDNTNDYYTSGGTLSVNNNIGSYTISNIYNNVYSNTLGNSVEESIIGHKYLIRCYITSPHTYSNRFNLYIGGSYNYFDLEANVEKYCEAIGTATNTQRAQLHFACYTSDGFEVNDVFTFRDFNCFDLTKMFGSGNEPSLQEFNTYFNLPYYPYTESQEVVIENYETITYNDTDIGSQFLYAMYIPISNYFNVSQLPFFNSMFQWFSYNIFGATAPMWFFIVYNLMMYWLIISLFWLIFDVLMYVPSMVHKMLDKARLE